jgi:hypothetical protein
MFCATRARFLLAAPAALERIKPDWALPYREAVKLGKHGTNQHTRGVGNTKSNVGSTVD